MGRATYIAGSFCVSMTAAMGIPKLDAGPQKSVRMSDEMSLRMSVLGQVGGGRGGRTCRAEVG